MSQRSSMIFHSLSSNSYLRNLSPLSAVIASIADWYLSTKDSMSNVEFQRVTTSWGMSRTLSFKALHALRQAGSAIVVEWMMAKASCQIYIK